MSPTKLLLVMAGMLALCLVPGCEGSGDSAESGDEALGGTWNGTAAGRPLTMSLKQTGAHLSGSYKLSNPDFEESLSGTASSSIPPAKATLVGGGDRQFLVTFQNLTSMKGGFYKGTTPVGSVSATK